MAGWLPNSLTSLVIQTLDHILATMEIKLFCIFLVVLLGCAEFETKIIVPEFCKKDPPQERGRANIAGWFYDKDIDSCLLLFFGAHRAVNKKVNRFETKKECSKTCRPHVKSFCFDEPPKTSHGRLTCKWFYNSTQAKCFMVNINGQAPENTNLFDTEAECNTICRGLAQLLNRKESEAPKNSVELAQLRSKIHNYLEYNDCRDTRQKLENLFLLPGSRNNFVKYYSFPRSAQNGNGISHSSTGNSAYDPDYGPCAKPLPGPCKITDTEYYRYDMKTETCFLDTTWRCGGENAFNDLEDCQKRCGRFVQDKCKHRPQNISDWCSTNGPRSYYDEKEDMCKTYIGCDDHGIGFYDGKECNQTCLGRSRRR